MPQPSSSNHSSGARCFDAAKPVLAFFAAALCIAGVVYDSTRQRTAFYQSLHSAGPAAHTAVALQRISSDPEDIVDPASSPDRVVVDFFKLKDAAAGKASSLAAPQKFMTFADELQQKDSKDFNATLDAQLAALHGGDGGDGGGDGGGASSPTSAGAARIDPSSLMKQRDNGRKCEFYDELRRAVNFSKTKKRWLYVDQASGAEAAKTTICDGAVQLPIGRDALVNALANKRVLFLGDSVARNSFVLTMARMCNADGFDKCITRMPTYDFDIRNKPDSSGPMGCVPSGSAAATNVSQSTTPEEGDARDPKDPESIIGNDGGGGSNQGARGNMQHTMARSPCYRDGIFNEVYIRGLTTRFVPQDKQGRKQFLRKGMIGPALQMVFKNTTLIYLPVTKPQHLFRTGVWMARAAWKYLEVDVIIASIGPHLRFQEVEITPQTLPHGFAAIRRATAAPIIFAEFVHALRSHPDYIAYVDNLMAKLRGLLTPLGVTMVPQRFVTRDGFMLRSSRVQLSDKERPDLACGYYDLQHPALRCQNVATELLLAAALVKLLPPASRN